MSTPFVTMFSMEEEKLDRIIQAAQAGDLATLQTLDPDGSNPWIRAEQPTPLHIAASRGHLAIVDYYVKKLESRGEDINPVRGFLIAKTPLEEAVQNDRRAVLDYYVKKFESQGKEINPVRATRGISQGETVLHLAASYGHLDIVDYFVKKLEGQGKDINPVMMDGYDRGYTPLYIAAKDGHLNIVNYYIKKLESQGKDINPALATGKRVGWTPLHVAAVQGHLDIVKIFIYRLPELLNARIGDGWTAEDGKGQTAEEIAHDYHPDVSYYLHSQALLTQQLLKACSRIKSLMGAVVESRQKLFKTPLDGITTSHDGTECRATCSRPSRAIVTAN